MDPIYLDGRFYYLVPAEANDREPYHLLREALNDEAAIGIGQAVFSGKEQLAVLRLRGPILVMAMLNYAPELRNPKQLGLGGDDDVAPKNLRLARDLIRSMKSRRFNIAAYEDRYRGRVQELIAAKRKGKPLVTPADEEAPPVINLMEALKKSLPKAKPHANGKPRSRRRRTRAG